MPRSPISGAATTNPDDTSAITAAAPNSAYASSPADTGGVPAAAPALGAGKSAMASTLPEATGQMAAAGNMRPLQPDFNPPRRRPQRPDQVRSAAACHTGS